MTQIVTFSMRCGEWKVARFTRGKKCQCLREIRTHIKHYSMYIYSGSLIGPCHD